MGSSSSTIPQGNVVHYQRHFQQSGQMQAPPGGGGSNQQTTASAPPLYPSIGIRSTQRRQLNRQQSTPKIMYGFRPEITSGQVPNQPAQQYVQQPNSVYPPQQMHHQAAAPGTSQVSHDTSHDLILSRILAADEFLGRMDETDGKIRLMMSVDDKSTLYNRILELLGLRGHIQDELLRIQAMLAVDDHTLQRLQEFGQMYPRIVKVLVDLNTNYQQADIDTLDRQFPGLRELQASRQTTDSSTQSSISTSTAGAQSEFSTQTSSTSTSMSTGTDAGTDLSEVELKHMHDQEEQTVTVAFGERMLQSQNALSQEELDRLLNDHLRSMQTLRKKQNMDKAKFQQNLEAKLANRRRQNQMQEEEKSGQAALLSHHQGAPEAGPSNSQFVEDTEEETGTLEEILKRLPGKADDDFSDEFDDEALKDQAKTLKNEIMATRNNMTEEELRVILDNFRLQQEQQHNITDAEKNRHKQMLEEKLAQRRNNKAQSAALGVNGMASQASTEMVDKAINTDLITHYDREELGNQDKNFTSLLKAKGGRVDNDAFEAALKLHLNETDNLRKQRMLEREKLMDKLQEKLRQRQGQAAVNKEDAEVFDDELEEDLQQLQKKFKKTALDKKQSNAAEIEALLEQYRRDQEQIITTRIRERARSNDILKQKLESRRKAETPGDEVETAGADSEFFRQIQELQQRGEMSETALTELLKSYMAQTGGGRKAKQKPTARTQQELDKEAMESVSSLVQEHQENQKQIQSLRQHEKSMLDAKLKRKLKAQKKPQPIMEEPET